MTETILPHELPGALDRAGDGLKVLSLDCFDTLLWRDCHAPTDVFAALPRLTVQQRVVAETQARKAEATLRQRSEVGLGAIYAHAMPNADKAEREAAIAEELAAEASACFAFAPTVELMRAAKARGLTVIIVSDTYLDAAQLHELIERAAGAEVARLIDRLFASSQEGISKSQGLLRKALKAMKCAPGEALHIGDNEHADFQSARAMGVPALHLVQFGKAARQRLKFERACQQLVGDSRDQVRGLMPHRPLLAQEEPLVGDSAQALGLTVLGPVFHAYDQWLRREAEALACARGGTVHWLFMLRDGHLPHLVHQACGEAPSAARVEISRFVAIGASLTSRGAYERHLALELGLNPATLARQMLFEEDEITRIVGEPESDAELVEASRRLAAEMRKGQRQKLTVRRARARAERLVAHVRAAVNPQPGDTLMLVDLGYNGSAQDRIDAILSEAFDVHVAGRYLLLREMAASGLDKKGLIDARHYDTELLEALCGNVAVIEQLATCALGSVVDFSAEGEPIRKPASVKGAQSAVRDRVQAGVVRYAEAAREAPVLRTALAHEERGQREAALGALARFMFLPQAHELEVIRSFEHDVNLGSARMVPLFDSDHAREGMRRRGLFYMKGSARMFLPAELAQEDIHARLSLLVQNRFGLGLSYTDTGQPTIAIPAYFLSKGETAHAMIEARPTHEGHYSARLPLPAEAQSIALMVGSVFEWFELAGVTIAPVETLEGGRGNDKRARRIEPQFDGIMSPAPGIHECSGAGAFMLVMLPRDASECGQQMIEVTLRPLRRRSETDRGTRPIPEAQAA